MNEQIKELIDKFPVEIIDMFHDVRQLIFDSVSCNLEEVLWAKLPSYYVGKSFEIGRASCRERVSSPV